MRVLRLSALIVMAAWSLPLLAQSINLRPGRYEAVMNMEMPGGVKMPMKSAECLTAADLKDVSKAFLEDIAQDCKVADLKHTGNRLSFTATCKADGITTAMNADMTFTGDAYSATIKATMGKDQAMNVTLAGKRVGDCSP